jgi:hypothetical protein
VGQAPADALKVTTPDVTPVQKLATAGGSLVAAILVLCNVFGWTTMDAVEGAAIVGVYVAFASVAMAADAVIRHGRSRSFQPPPMISQFLRDSAAPWPGEEELRRQVELAMQARDRERQRPQA